MAVHWLDNNKVLLLSNCHTDSLGQIKKQKYDHSRKLTCCILAIQFYQWKMSGVDRANQMVGIHKFD